MLAKETYHVKKGDFVLIHAIAGGVGQVLCQICKSLGATVIGTTSSNEKAAIAKSLGADHVIDYTKVNVLDEVKKITNGVGVHVVYDGVGKDTFETSLASLRPHGWMITFGNASGKPEPFDVLRLSKGSVKLMRPTLFDFISTAADFERLSRDLFDNYIVSGKLKVQVSHVYALEEAPKCHQDLQNRATTGKLVLKL